MTESPRFRAAGVALLLVALAGMLVWGGSASPEPADRDFPDEDDVGPDPGSYVGDRVVLSGTVVGTDPVVLEATYGTGDALTVTVRGVDQPVSEGNRMSAFGTLTGETTLDAERVIVREPWEMWYMYTASFVAGLWVLGRTVRRWRFDPDRVAFVPREEPLGPWGGRDA